MTQEEARLEIGRAARAMLAGTLSYIEGARKITELRFPAHLDRDADVTRFVAIDSATDALPFGALRQHWQPSALTKLQPEIERAEAWVREFGSAATERLAARFLE